ncbi:hypothetical protein TIFTF001_044962 [Ficus carica]|uniref:MULE transposase domain-containing protein n=1 Tax=Ficus carica TaxID=3494 RepID=A0AA87ZET9_FICCA|nr:hypothetical protein TIFTF001_044962 [Ficus carica]
MQAEFGVSFNYLRAWRGKEAALTSLRGDDAESYKVIVVDGSALKARFGGMLLAACGHDTNGSIFPLAFGIVPSKSNESWQWFFEKIRDSICTRESLAIVADRHKGIENEANLVFPNATFGICVQHLAANLKTRYKDFKGPLKTYFDGASRSYLVSEHNRHMESIRSRNADMHRYLLQADPTKWSRAYFSGRRELLQRWFVQRREEALKITSKLALNAEILIRTNFSLGLTVTPRPADQFEYSVTNNAAQIVNPPKPKRGPGRPRVKYSRRVSDGEITRAKINTFVNIKETFKNLRNWLSPRQYEMVIHQPCIQHFMKLNTLGWAGQLLHNTLMRLTDHSDNGDALWFQVGEELGRFSIYEFGLITGMKCVGFTHLPPMAEPRLIRRYFQTVRGVSRENLELQMSNAKFNNDEDAIKLSLLYIIFCIPLSNANSVKIDPKFFALADNLDEFNKFPWDVLSSEATRAAICATVDNRTSSKRRPLKKSRQVHYSIAGFPHALLVWAYESIPTMAAKFTTNYEQAIPRMLSWITADNVKFDEVMWAFTAVGENQPKCVGMMSTEEELKDPWVAQLFFKNPKAVPQLLLKPSVARSSSGTNSEWQEFKEEIRGQMDSINKSLQVLKKDQKKSNKLLRRVLKMLTDNMSQQGQGKAQSGTPVTTRQPMDVPTNESDALKTTYDDIATSLQDEVLIDSSIGTAADIGVQAA